MSAAAGWDLLFRRDDLTTSEVGPGTMVPLRPGDVRLAVEHLAITNSTATYARLRDSPMRFLSVFPAPEGFVRVPAWGFARVVESRHPRVEPGRRYFGFLPMSTHHTIAPQVIESGLFDTTPQRSFLHDWYRTYETAEPHELDDRRALLHPLFPASFNLAEFVDRRARQGVTATLVTSASCKVAIGLAYLLARHGGVHVTGVTATEHESFVSGLGLYDSVVAYEDLASVPVDRQTVFIDFTNSIERMREVYRHFSGWLAATVLVGFTHPRLLSEPPRFHDPVPEHFFAPAAERQHMARQGAESYRRRYAEAEAPFIADTVSWLTVARGSGATAMSQVLVAALAGKQPPDVGDVLTP
jgi:hypothetical protein